MKWILILVPITISFYTATYGLWAWKKGNRKGGVGVFILVAFTMALSVYAIFIRTGF